MNNIYDTIIIGTGPAGISASIFASCFGLHHILVGKVPGGQVSLAPDILNYPGFDEISGAELTEKFFNQVKKRGAEIIIDSVVEIVKRDQLFDVKTETGKIFSGKTIILATGVERRKLNIPGENEYTGRGIQYCATCGQFDYKGKVAAVVGGANSAAQTAYQVAGSASKVFIIYRGSELRCDTIWKENIEKHPNIEVLFNSTPIEITGDGQRMTGVKMQTKNAATGVVEEKNLPADRLFIEIGGVPGTALLIPLGVKMESGNFIAVDETLSTNVPGVYAAGDVISHRYSVEQITSAVGLGSRAAAYVFSYLKRQTAPSLWGANKINRISGS